MRTPSDHGHPRSAEERFTAFMGPAVIALLVIGIIVFLIRHWGA